jgi:hypothetical protein
MMVRAWATSKRLVDMPDNTGSRLLGGARTSGIVAAVNQAGMPGRRAEPDA